MSENPVFNEIEFQILVNNTKTSSQMLSMDPDKIMLPPREQLVVLRTKTLLHDAKFYFGESSHCIVSRNVSPFKSEANEIIKSKVLKSFVMSTMHGRDMVLFDYTGQ